MGCCTGGVGGVVGVVGGGISDIPLNACQISYPKIVSSSALIVYNAMNYPGGAVISFYT